LGSDISCIIPIIFATDKFAGMKNKFANKSKTQLSCMKRYIAFFCFLLFSFQVIPVKEIGELLFKGQITEEEIHSSGNQQSEAPNAKLKKDGDNTYYYNFTQYNSRIEYANLRSDIAIQQAEKLPVSFVADIVTPPPNHPLFL
jgi:hypothetical protein